MKRKILSMALVLALLCTLLPQTIPVASAATYTGSCGDNVSWELDTKTGVLTISGTGAMEDYTYSRHAPWNNNKDSVKSVRIEHGVTSIGYLAFWSCNNLTSVTIPNSVTTIGGEAFHYCTNLASVTIPNSVTSIGYSAFGECTSLTSVTIPDSVTSIGRSAFESCESLTSITIPDSVTSIGEWAFQICTSLTSVTISNSITSIANGTFCSCSSLTSITIPNSVTSIEFSAFELCTSLTSITITDSVTSIGDFAFSGCTSLTNICVAPENANYTSVDGVLFSKNMETLICYPEGKAGAYKVPDSVTSIGDNAFSGCSKLISVTIPNSITEINSNAFSGCTNLASVSLPDSVTEIGFAAFSGCTSLVSVSLPDSVTAIGECAFLECTSLTDVYYSGTEEEWAKISIGEDNECLTNATIHYKWGNLVDDDPVDDDPVDDDPVDDGPQQTYQRVCFFTKWDAEKQIAYLGRRDVVGCTITEQTDPTLPEQIGNLVGQYVLVSTISHSWDTVGPDTLISMQPVDTKMGTVTAADQEIITINGTTYATPEEWVTGEVTLDPTWCINKQVIYHLLNNKLVDVESLETEDGILTSWNAETRELTIAAGLSRSIVTYTLSPLADEDTVAYLDETKQRYTVQYTVDSERHIYHMEETIKSWVATSEWSFGNYTVPSIQLTDADFNAMMDGKSDVQKEQVLKLLAERGKGGHCYGMAVTSVLVNRGALLLDRIQPGLNTLYDAQKTASVKSIIGKYLIAWDSYENLSDMYRFFSLPLEEQLNLLTETPTPYVLSFGCDGWGAHSVTAYGWQTGSWSYHGHDYDTRILIYDSNFSTYGFGSSKAEKSFLYFNSQSLAWEIPNYYSGGISSDGKGYLECAQSDPAVLASINIQDGTYKYNVWLRNQTDSEFSIATFEKTYTVQGASSTIPGELFAYYDVGYNAASPTTPILNVRMNDLSDYTILPSEQTELNISVLYPDYALSVVSDSYDSLTLGSSGTLSATGLENTYDISLTANDGYSTLPWYTLEVSGSEASTISTEFTDQGILLSGDTLKGVTVYGKNDTETRELTFSTEEENVLISEMDNELAVSVDKDGDGTYETTINKTDSCTHNYQVTVIAPTCTESGCTIYVCDTCGTYYTDNVVPALGHDFVDGYCTHCHLDKNCPSLKFIDAPEPTSWAHSGIDFGVRNGYINGTSGNTVSPYKTMTRAELVTVLYRMAGSPQVTVSNTFTDVASGTCFTNAIIWAAENGIVLGDGSGHFNPTDNVTREQIALILYRFALYQGADIVSGVDLTGFSDCGKVSAWAKGSMGWAVAEQLITGRVIEAQTLIAPQGSAMRAEVATILMRYAENVTAAP